ncbi:MAG TPA: cytidine 5'-phosphate N-acetylneuraminic acid synthetase, partial [Campylobacterales bacterium]|nr:cytidine 5'-phosphate N-acetylneuraminic acid synthetase [Campylobacterales bacterium]
MKSEYCIIIPAIKKNGVIPDQLIKKLNGITLIQRAINTAKEVRGDIYVVTDSQEISLIAERNGVKYIYNPQFRIDERNIFNSFRNFLQELQQYENFLIYRANTPLVDSDILISAYREFLENREKILISVREEKRFAYLKDKDRKYIRTEKNLFSEINSFIITSSKNLFSNSIGVPNGN